MTDHRAEADYIMRQGATATERLLAAIHDEQQAQTGLLTDLRGAIDDLAEVLRPRKSVYAYVHPADPKVGDEVEVFGPFSPGGPGGHVAGPTEVHEAGGCDECSCDWCTEPDPEPDAKSDPGPEPAPRALICTEAEAEAHREVRRLVITTYQIEDDPAVLRGADGADMTTAALVWLEGFVQAVDPDAHPAYTGKGIAPLIRAREAAAWNRGFDRGYSRGRNPYLGFSPNPYMQEDDDARN